MSSDNQLVNNRVMDNRILEITKNPGAHAVALRVAMNRFRNADTVLSNIELRTLEGISADPDTVFANRQGNIEASSKNRTATFSLSVGENGSILLNSIKILPSLNIVDGRASQLRAGRMRGGA